MKLSSRAVYGIRVCALIATEERPPVSVAALAAKTQLSEKYLEQILGSLVKGGLLASTRGAGGGYALAKSADDITLYEVLGAVDDAFEIGCADGKCARGGCPDRATFEKIAAEINGIFASRTLASIARGREEQ